MLYKFTHYNNVDSIVTNIEIYMIHLFFVVEYEFETLTLIKL